MKISIWVRHGLPDLKDDIEGRSFRVSTCSFHKFRNEEQKLGGDISGLTMF